MDVFAIGLACGLTTASGFSRAFVWQFPPEWHADKGSIVASRRRLSAIRPMNIKHIALANGGICTSHWCNGRCLAIVIRTSSNPYSMASEGRLGTGIEGRKRLAGMTIPLTQEERTTCNCRH